MTPTGKTITLESNGECWLYDFSKLTAQQIFAAQSWFAFYVDILITPPPSAKHLKLSGATDYLREAISLLILPCKKDESGVLIVEAFDPESTPARAANFYDRAVNVYSQIKEIENDFFLITKTSSPQSVLKSKRQTEIGAVLLRLLQPKNIATE